MPTTQLRSAIVLLGFCRLAATHYTARSYVTILMSLVMVPLALLNYNNQYAVFVLMVIAIATGFDLVSNPVCYPCFRASVSVTVQKAAFATGVPPNIYAFHRYTRNSAFLSCTQVLQFARRTQVKPVH